MWDIILFHPCRHVFSEEDTELREVEALVQGHTEEDLGFEPKSF